jgi:hypothetical protein
MNRTKLMRAALMATLLALSGVGAANAAAPGIEMDAIDTTFTPPLLSATCGFDVTRHTFGTLTIRTYVDRNGDFVREVDAYHLTETVSANGNTLTGRTIQQIFVNLLPGGGYTVTIVGSDFRLSVPGSGISFGAVGRLVLVFSDDDELIDVTMDVGNVRADYEAICAALAA